MMLMVFLIFNLCPNTSAGVRIYPYNGCEDTASPVYNCYLNLWLNLKLSF
jgi:hypothetical protein